MIKFLPRNFVGNCPPVVFFSRCILCLSAKLEYCATLGGTQKVLSNFLPRQLPTCPSRNKVDFCKNKPYFWRKYALFFDGHWWQPKTPVGCLDGKSVQCTEAACVPPAKRWLKTTCQPFNICLVSCSIHEVGGCCLCWDRTRAAMIWLPQSLPALFSTNLPAQNVPPKSLSHPFCQHMPRTFKASLSPKVLATFPAQETAIKC